jgi:hypothetical protein
MPSESEKFEAQVRNLLIEFGVEPFVLVGYKGQDDFCLYHTRGNRDLRGLNDLFVEFYKENFEPDDVEFEMDENFWEED